MAPSRDARVDCSLPMTVLGQHSCGAARAGHAPTARLFRCNLLRLFPAFAGRPIRSRRYMTEQD
jgi:hypothetical protein